MVDYVANPRRAPRAPTRCAARVEVGRQAIATETEDVGPHGCQVVMPAPLTVGQALRVTVQAPAGGAPLAVPARVIWTSSRAPWRAGLAFDASVYPATTQWWERLLASNPGLANFRRVPDRLPLDAMVYLGPPPRFTDFTDDELQVMSRVANGTTVADLQARMGDRWATGRRMLFALLSRGLLTLAKGAASHVGVWRQILREAGTTFQEAERPLATVTRSWLLAVGQQPGGADGDPAPPPAAPTPHPAAAHDHLEPLDVDIDEAPVEPAPHPAAAAPMGDASAGNGWRGVKHARNADAQRAYELGKSELAGGRARSAVALLRMALQHAPGDEEIAVALAKALQG